MIGLLQRVSEARVEVGGEVTGAIGAGLAVLVCAEWGDDEVAADRLLERLLTYRVFPDAAGKMNRSIRDIEGGLLLVPQFTLAADTRSGTRPGFSTSAPPDLARFGDSFVEVGRTAILIVPSALAPAESNLLLNPRHKDFSKIRVASIEAFQYDSRFFG